VAFLGGGACSIEVWDLRIGGYYGFPVQPDAGTWLWAWK